MAPYKRSKRKTKDRSWSECESDCGSDDEEQLKVDCFMHMGNPEEKSRKMFGKSHLVRQSQLACLPEVYVGMEEIRLLARRDRSAVHAGAIRWSRRSAS